jgi:hypothetical protein
VWYNVGEGEEMVWSLVLNILLCFAAFLGIGIISIKTMRDPVRIISFIFGMALFLIGLICLPLYLYTVSYTSYYHEGLSNIQLVGLGIAMVALPLPSGIFLFVEAARAKPRLVTVLSAYLGVLTLIEVVSFIIVFDYYSERAIIGPYPLGIGNLIGLILIFLLAFLLLSPGRLYRRYPNLVTYLGIACASAGGIGLIISADIILLGQAWEIEESGDIYYGLVVAAVALLAFIDGGIIFTRVRRKR